MDASMLDLVLALLAGVVTVAAPCTLPMLPILLGASVGQTGKVRPAMIALSVSATSENDSTKPAAIVTGRALLVWPTDAPSRIGSIGSVQGAAMVTTPASSARTRLSISAVRILFEHDLFGKPVSTFPDHARGDMS